MSNMALKNVKYRFNAQTWTFYLDSEYVPLPGVLLEFLFYLSYTVDLLPFLPTDQRVCERTPTELRKSLGRHIGPQNANELIECISNYGYRFNPALVSKGLLAVENKPRADNSIHDIRYTSIDELRPFPKKNGGYHSSEKDEEATCE